MLTPRQHHETELTELAGKNCDEVLIVPGERENTVIVFYLNVEGVWLRMYLDAGLLFADECNGPDPDDDLDEGEKYVSLLEKAKMKSWMIQTASMRDNKFDIIFSGGDRVTFQQDNDETKYAFKCI